MSENEKPLENSRCTIFENVGYFRVKDLEIEFEKIVEVIHSVKDKIDGEYAHGLILGAECLIDRMRALDHQAKIKIELDDMGVGDGSVIRP